MSAVTRGNVAGQSYSQIGTSRNDSAIWLESVLEAISSTLARGETGKLSGFGTFAVRQKGRRVGRNPKTGIEVPILPRAVLVFRPSQILRARMNGDELTNEAETLAVEAND
mgnify:CR=1 FL=1